MKCQMKSFYQVKWFSVKPFTAEQVMHRSQKHHSVLEGLLMKVKEENENTGLKLNIQKIKIMASFSSLHGK